MNTDAINKSFTDLLSQRGVGKKLGISNSMVSTLRYNLANDINISLEKKIALLQKSGWRQPPAQYSHADLVLLAKFILRSSAAAKDHGPEYLVEKFLKTR